NELGRRLSQLLADSQRSHEPEADRLTVGEPCITALGFEGMTQRVTEIQPRANAALAFVRCHHPRLQSDRAPHDSSQDLGLPARNGGGLVFQEREELRVADQRGLDHFCERASIRPLALALNGVRVTHDPARLPKGTHRILRRAEVYSGL